VRGDNRREIEREVERHPGVRLSWEDRGKHLGAVLTLNGRSRTVFIGRTCSDHRALHNQRAHVRQAIRTLRETN
jgi:hypothetical protein